MTERFSEARVPTAFGTLRMRVYDAANGAGPIAVFAGERFRSSPAPVLIHRGCFLSENLGYTGCECRERLTFALETIGARGGVVIYLRRHASGRGIADELRERLVEHAPIEAENVIVAADVLRALGVRSIRLIGDDRPAAVLETCGITVADRMPFRAPRTLAPLAFLRLPIRRRRPFVHVNFAVDGRAGSDVASISCDTDWRRVHELREQVDAVAVGARTWNSDRPRLNVRAERLGREPRRQPARAVFAGQQACDMIESAIPLYLIGAPATACSGATVIPAADHDLRAPLEALYEHGIRSMLVEGGPTILRSFFAQQLVDAVTIFVRVRDEQTAHDAARRALPFLPSALSAQAFGEGVLLRATAAGA